MDKTQLNLVVKTITYIIRRSVNFIMKPETMIQSLIEIVNLNKDKANLFTKFWVGKTKNILEDVNSGRELIDVQWDLKTELASAAEQKSRTAIGVVRLETADKGNLNLELNHNELLELYKTLENVQEELDILKDIQPTT